MCDPRFCLLMKYLPNAITIIRIIVTPILLVLLLSGTFVGQLSALILFVFAAISDYLDGKLARVLKVGSRLGQFLDPLADKVLVIGTFAALSYLIPEQVPWWGVLLIVVRDVAVTLLRTWAESRGRTLRTLPLAKGKTTIQLTFLITVLLLLTLEKLVAPQAVRSAAQWILQTPIVYVGMMIVVVFTVITGLVYFFKHEYVRPVELDR